MLLMRKHILRFAKKSRTWKLLTLVHVKSLEVIDCDCIKYQEKCKGKYIKTRLNQNTCLWDYLNKQNI